MEKKKKKKSSLNQEDKILIGEMKEQLKMMGIPREEWSKIIQQELTFRKKYKGLANPLKGGIGNQTHLTVSDVAKHGC